MMDWKVPLFDLDYGEAEEQAVLEVLRSGWLTMGQTTQRFESRFADQIGTRYAIAVSNATVALHLACLALEIGPGDEVIVPSLTFVATANAVRYTGAQVRFADIQGHHDLTVSPEAIRLQITPRTRAIVVMHYAGFPCQMEAITRLARQHDLAVIEDAAHAPGAALHGKHLGTWGEVGCFSFFSNKNLVTGEGGMLVTDSEEIAEKVRLLRSHGMTSLTWDRHRGHAYSYDVIALGYNYRFDEMRAALGLVQLEKLEQNNQLRRELMIRYWDGLADTGLGLPFRQGTGKGSYHIMPVLVPDAEQRQDLMDYLRTEGIQTSIHYPPIHQFQEYLELSDAVELPVTDEVASREMTLPLYPSMSDHALERVVHAVKRGLDRLPGLAHESHPNWSDRRNSPGHSAPEPAPKYKDAGVK